MAHVIYNKATTRILRARARSVNCWVDSYMTRSAARAALTRLTKKGALEDGCTKDDYAIDTTINFRKNIEKQETCTNMMSGNEIQQSVNTPLCCDPSSETYWSM